MTDRDPARPARHARRSSIDLDRARRQRPRASSATLDARGIAPPAPRQDPQERRASARLQVEAGARGLTVGTLGEAEVFASGRPRRHLRRLPRLGRGAEGGTAARARTRRRTCGSASTRSRGPSGWRAPWRARPRGSRSLVEIDPGIASDGRRAPLGGRRSRSRGPRRPGLEVEGVFTHGGHSYRPGRAGAAVARRDHARSRPRPRRSRRRASRSRSISAGSTPTRCCRRTRPRERDPRRDVRPRRPPAGWPSARSPADGMRGRRRGHGRVGGRGPVRPGRGGQGADQGPADWLEGYGAVAALSRRGDRAAVRLPRRRPGPARCAAAAASGEVVAVVPNHICPVVDLVSSSTS